MNYRNVYRVMSVKNAYIVLMEIYNGCKTDDFRSFQDLRESIRMNKSTLRRITNRLSSCGLIRSIKDNRMFDGRKKVFVITDKELVEKMSDLTQYIAQ